MGSFARVVGIIFVQSFVMVVGCSSGGGSSGGALTDGGTSADGSSSTVPDGSSSTTTDGNIADAAVADGGCTGLANTAPGIQSTGTPDPLPSPTGGTIVDGTYFLTAEVEYASSSGGGVEHHETLVIDAGTFTIVKNGLNGEDRSTWTYTVAQNELTRVRTCPSKKTEQLGYDASATEFTTLDSLSKVAKTYRKQ